MKLTKTPRFFVIIFFAVQIVSFGFWARAQGVDPTAPRDWRAYGGHTMTAGFVKLNGDAVVLKGADGSVRNVPLHMLIPEDQALAKELGAQIAAGGTHAVKPGKGKELATFVEGPGKGNFAYYEHENFIVRISSAAKISIQCLEDGKPVGKPIAILMGHSYRDLQADRSPERQIVSFAEEYHPVLQPDAVTLEGVLTDNVPFGFTLAFEGPSIRASGWVNDTTGVRDSRDYRPSINFAVSHQFEAHVLVVDQKAAVQHCSLEIDPLKGKAFSHPYGENAQAVTMPLRTVAVKGDVFGSRQLSISVGPSRAGEMYLFTSYSTPIYHGFQLILQKKNPASCKPPCPITLTIN